MRTDVRQKRNLEKFHYFISHGSDEPIMAFIGETTGKKQSSSVTSAAQKLWPEMVPPSTLCFSQFAR